MNVMQGLPLAGSLRVLSTRGALCRNGVYIQCFVAFMALWLAGCGSAFMRPAVASPPRSPDAAYVCFLRPSKLGGAVQYTIMDDQRRFLGEAVYSSRWTVELEPGKHWLYAWGDNTSVLQADLLAGHIYYVVVRPRMGGFGPRVQLTALTPRSPEWHKVNDWLKNSEALVADRQAGQTELDKSPELMRSKMSEAIEVWSRMTAQERELHTLLPGDGLPL